VTNQLVLACKEYIQQATYNYADDNDLLWQRVQEEIESRHEGSPSQASIEPPAKQLQNQLNAKLKVSISVNKALLWSFVINCILNARVSNRSRLRLFKMYSSSD
jgi:hypothetical protein